MSTATEETHTRSLKEKLIALLERRAVPVVLAIVGLFWLIPGLGLFITSLRPVAKYAESGFWDALLHPGQLTLENYVGLIGDPSLLKSLWATLLISVPSTIFPILIAAAAGYALAWIPFKGRDATFLVIVGLLVVPVQMALIPAFGMFRALGISGIPAVILFHTAFGLPFSIFLMRSFFAGLPPSLLEAAQIDGASEWKTFTKVVLPNGFPAIASLAIFQFTWTWNDLLVALVFAGDQRPLTLFIRDRLGEFGSGIGVIAPGVFISAILPVVIFLSFQKYFEAGFLGGSVK